jgi:hypothetical protein
MCSPCRACASPIPALACLTAPPGRRRGRPCRTLGKSQNTAEEIGRLTDQLDRAFRTVAGNLSQNAGARLEPDGADVDLVLTGLDRLDEPASLVALRNAVAARLPRVDLPELLQAGRDRRRPPVWAGSGVTHLAGHGRRSRGRDGTARALRPMALFLRRRREYRQSRGLAETIQQLG